MLKVGDIVVLTTEGLIKFGARNRLKKHNTGKIYSVVGKTKATDFNYLITWDTGHDNSYRNCDVQLLEEENE